MCCVSVAMAHAQEEEVIKPVARAPETLIEARKVFLGSILEESKLLTEQFVRALGKTESDAAAVEDYAEALRIQNRRNELTAIYAGGASSLAESEAVVLDPAVARVGGGVEVRLGQVSGWRSKGSYAEWSAVSIPSGEYDLMLEAAMVPAPGVGSGAGSGGTRPEPMSEAAFEFYEVSLLQGATDNRRGFDINPTADGATYASYRMGPISYSRSPVTLRLAAVNAYPLNIIRIRNIRLVPAEVETDVVATAQGTSQEQTSLADGRESLREELQRVFRKAVDDYTEELREWAAGNKAKRNLVSEEVAFLKRQMEEFKNGSALMPPILGLLGGFGGFQDIPEAMLVSGQMKSGDVMEFSSEDGTHEVRLFGVRCMPLDGDDEETSAYFASRFGISEADAASLGGVAQEFTAGYLEGRIVRLLVQRPRKEENDAPPLALVFLPDIGLFQNVLVDQGLAAVKEDEAPWLKGSMPKAVIDALKAREVAASNRERPPGAWALRPETGGEDR